MGTTRATGEPKWEFYVYLWAAKSRCQYSTVSTCSSTVDRDILQPAVFSPLLPAKRKGKKNRASCRHSRRVTLIRPQAGDRQLQRATFRLLDASATTRFPWISAQRGTSELTLFHAVHAMITVPCRLLWMDYVSFSCLQLPSYNKPSQMTSR